MKNDDEGRVSENKVKEEEEEEEGGDVFNLDGMDIDFMASIEYMQLTHMVYLL